MEVIKKYKIDTMVLPLAAAGLGKAAMAAVAQKAAKKAAKKAVDQAKATAKSKAKDAAKRQLKVKKKAISKAKRKEKKMTPKKIGRMKEVHRRTKKRGRGQYLN